MSRGGTPTDNPIIEALNGWIKEELFLDFDLANASDVPALLDDYVRYFNFDRSAAALGYQLPPAKPVVWLKPYKGIRLASANRALKTRQSQVISR